MREVLAKANDENKDKKESDVINITQIARWKDRGHQNQAQVLHWTHGPVDSIQTEFKYLNVIDNILNDLFPNLQWKNKPIPPNVVFAEYFYWKKTMPDQLSFASHNDVIKWVINNNPDDSMIHIIDPQHGYNGSDRSYGDHDKVNNCFQYIVISDTCDIIHL